MRRRPPRYSSGLGWLLVAFGLVFLASRAAPVGASDTLAVSPRAAVAVAYARAQVGDPYVWGADGPNAWDCSGLTGGAWRHAGYRWPDLTAAGQYRWLADRHRTVTRAQLKPGDLVFYASSSNWRLIHHVAMYVGGARMVEAPQRGVPVREVRLRTPGWYGAARPGGGEGA